MWVSYPQFRTGRGKKLQELLEIQTVKFKREEEEVKGPIQELLEEIMNALQQQGVLADRVWSASTPSLVKAVHIMLGLYLGKYQTMVAKLPT